MDRVAGRPRRHATLSGWEWIDERDAMSDLWDEVDDDDVSPICDACGVSALPPEAPGEPSMCESPNCPAFGDLMDR